MAKIHRGATLTPHFGEFLPPWLARQPWYEGAGTPDFRPIGFFRFEDPAGEVGMETLLLADGGQLYQVPLTYRGAKLPGPAAEAALVATPEHSVLGTRWIYDATADPVWLAAMRRLVSCEAISDSSGRLHAEARGVRLGGIAADASIELRRVLAAGDVPTSPEQLGPDACGYVRGSWHRSAGPAQEVSDPVSGLLAVLRR